MTMTSAPLNTGPLVLGWGLHITSAIPLPGATPILGGSHHSATTGDQVTVMLGLSCAPEPWPELYRWDGVALEFAPPGVAQFRITGTTIQIQPHPAANFDSITALLVATAFPALLWLKGYFVLHAAALALPESEHTLAITGPSGAGKSTLARWFIQQGAILEADDSLAICPEDDPPVGYGLANGTWSGPPGDRHFVGYGPVDRRGKPTGLGAIIVLTPGSELTLRPLHRLHAFSALMQHRHRPRVPALIGNQQEMMDQAGALCRRVPHYELMFDKQRHSPQELGSMIVQNLGKGSAHR